jgi:hypothetical protein
VTGDGLDPRLAAFIGVVLAPEVVVRIRAARRWMGCQPVEHRDQLRDALLELIEGRRLTLREWSQINDLEFADVGSLYGYLGAVYDFFFRDSPDPPQPPWLNP